MITADEARLALNSNPDRLRAIEAGKKDAEEWIGWALRNGKQECRFCWNGVESPVTGEDYDINAEMIEWFTSLGYRVTPCHRFATLHYTVEW